jgi:hypothetical protein
MSGEESASSLPSGFFSRDNALREQVLDAVRVHGLQAVARVCLPRAGKRARMGFTEPRPNRSPTSGSVEVLPQVAPVRARRQSRPVHCSAAGRGFSLGTPQVIVAAPDGKDNGGGMASFLAQTESGNRRLLHWNPKTRSRLRGGLEVELSHPGTLVTVTIPLAARKSMWTLVRKSASEESV